MNQNLLLNCVGSWDENTQYNNSIPLLGSGAQLFNVCTSTMYNNILYYVNGTSSPIQGTTPPEDSAWSVAFDVPYPLTLQTITSSGTYNVQTTQNNYQFIPGTNNINIVFNANTTSYGPFSFKVLDQNSVNIVLTDANSNTITLVGKNQGGYFLIKSDGVNIVNRYIADMNMDSFPALIEYLPNGRTRETGFLEFPTGEDDVTVPFALSYPSYLYLFVSVIDSTAYSYTYQVNLASSGNSLRVQLSVPSAADTRVYYQIIA